MLPAVAESQPSEARSSSSHADPTRGRRLVIVSNRVADGAAESHTGGLSVALSEALAGCGGLWFGWNGKVEPAGTQQQPDLKGSGAVTRATLPLSAKERRGYYLGFANSCLWPVLHYRVDLMRYRPEDSDIYWRVNGRFAAALRPLLRPGDLVWAHDFHLIPLAQHLRAQGWRGQAGFFLHTPFPSPEIFASIPGHRDLARALMAFDVIGLQTQSDRRNFAAYLETAHEGAIAGDRLEAFGRKAVVAAFPVGINVAAVARAAAADDGAARDPGQPRLIVGVDRLDYTKGIPERLLAYERLLEQQPARHGHVTLVQIAPPTREGVSIYAELTEEVQRLVGRINGRFGTLVWTPVTFINRPMRREALLKLFRRASVGLVTPLRDGMNLVAKEFVAAQDAADPGVLVLSQFAGAAEGLTAAIIVNPHDADMLAAVLGHALDMPLLQRRTRQKWLRAQIARSDITAWTANYLSVLSSVDEADVETGDTLMVGAA